MKGTRTADRSGDIYAGRDPAQIPAYTISVAAHLLGVPISTTRAWLLGQRNFPSVVKIADPRARALSFQNLVELHVLAAIRRQHRISLQRVRRAVDYMGPKLRIEHPLANRQMLTDGRDILLDWFGQFLNVSQHGQGEMRQLLKT